MRFRLCLAALAAAVLAESGTAVAAPTSKLSEQSLLWRLTVAAGQLARLPAGVSVDELSSHDLTGGNVDGGSDNDTLGQTGVLPPTYVRIVDGAYVLADEPGPGCLLRIWMTGDTNQVQGDPGSFGASSCTSTGARRRP